MEQQKDKTETERRGASTLMRWLGVFYERRKNALGKSLALFGLASITLITGLIYFVAIFFTTILSLFCDFEIKDKIEDSVWNDLKMWKHNENA